MLIELIQKEKEKIADGILLFYGIFVVLPVAASLFRAVDIGWQPAMYSHILVLVVAWVLYLLKNKISYTHRAVAIVITFAFAGMSGVMQFGVLGIGWSWLLLSPLLATLFFGIRVGVSITLLCSLFCCGVAIFIIQGEHVMSIDIATYALSPRSWLTYILSFFFISTVISVALGKLYDGLVCALEAASIRNEEIEAIVTQRTNELNAANKELEKIASRDPLTQLYNRRAFSVLAEEEMSRAGRCGTSLSLALIDVDNFKRVNDIFGHEAGDAVLSELAKIFTFCTNEEVICCRWGGEEFIIAIVNATSESAEIAINEIRELISLSDFEPVDKITVSVGISEYQYGDDFRVWLGRADAALYKAKSNGKNCIMVANP